MTRPPSCRRARLSNFLDVPILSELAPGRFNYGRAYLVEFEPHSLWYETSFAIAAAAVSKGFRTEYHTFMHSPKDVREALMKLGLNVKESEEKGLFRILDTYTASLGLGVPEKLGGVNPSHETGPFTLEEWEASMVRQIQEGVPEGDKKWLHIDDNTSVFTQSNDEKEILNAWRTRFLPFAKTRELLYIPSIVSGAASDTFYRQCESLYDGIFDFASREEGGKIEHYARVRTLHGTPFDTRWRLLKLQDTGEVRLQTLSMRTEELGIGRWLKGSMKQSGT